MMPEPRCFTRKCKHYTGVKQDKDGEVNERQVCVAFPDGIPDEIAYGDELHIGPWPDDNGIRFEKSGTSSP